MSIPKVQVFVDGENLVMRYQAMLAADRKPRQGVIHVKDAFVWHPSLTTWSCMDIQRVTYYTSATGDQTKLRELKATVANTDFESFHEFDNEIPRGVAQVLPRVYHKSSKSRKTRNVDINIVIDMMRAAHTNSVEILLLYSGDGDYIPVIEECMRQGKTVWCCSFSSGLNPDLFSAVDLYVSLDDIFFLPTKQST
ncbi:MULTISPECIES: NYN domain-containing protein [Acidithiobacillus]|uniref:NYN domain-containing protein n=2 Tax=Acidithiobacillus TaxID=119977 RepID=A0A179BPT3_ACIFR|nr:MULTISPECIES: NYN domain-containing protein [Acidithiobacillus]MEB8486706.1 NYN domain-containing protein [Acidithiobacillus ferriphilus]MEB8489662.1 NYN domain-containing protein [Acidithiobacillus ferriphilus]MEB8494390.1 NYN domain-containing protein [Acidithiobacillus ferriphilus]MEB8515158.1 NYN domain-containing protein [Acidithiobacillus ferriphilus]MEB8520634.1 NYN domain-containing protein [Acidithiobacillus ferriphilus]